MGHVELTEKDLVAGRIFITEMGTPFKVIGVGVKNIETTANIDSNVGVIEPIPVFLEYLNKRRSYLHKQ